MIYILLKAQCSDFKAVDYFLTLQNLERKQTIGTLGLNLQNKANNRYNTSRIAASRQMVEASRSKLIDTLGAEYSDKSQTRSTSQHTTPDANTSTSEDLDGFGALNRVHERLKSMKSGKLKASLDVIDTAARVCSPSYRRSWNIITDRCLT